jgi:hypothetical protein
LKLTYKEDVICGIVDEEILTYFPREVARISWTGFKQRFESNNGDMKIQMKS